MSYKGIVFVFVVAALIAPTFAVPNTAAAYAAAVEPLNLVSSRDNIEGSFTTNQSVYATQKNIYLASAQGTLFVLKRSKAENFPVIQTLNIGSPLTAVRGYDNKLFVASSDGYLRQYTTTNPLKLVKTVQLSTYGLRGIAVTNNTVYVSRGQTTLAVDSGHVYLAQLNEGETVVALNNQLAVTKTFGETFEQGMTVVYNRSTGARKGSVPNPITLLNEVGFPSLFAFNNNLFQTVPGCCGAGVVVTPNQMLTTPRIVSEYFANAVTLNSKGLVIGNESGNVSLYNFSSSAITHRHTLDLRQLTNHTGAEDIEIRSVWSDNYDNLVFAGSSWGNSTTQSPDLPSFFVLQTN